MPDDAQIAINMAFDKRLKALEEDDAKVHGLIGKAYDWTTKLLQQYPWASTVWPVIVTAIGAYFAAQNGLIGPPAKEIPVPGPEKTIIREVPAAKEPGPTVGAKAEK